MGWGSLLNSLLKNYNYKNKGMDWKVVYAKFDGCKTFKAFDVVEGKQVGNIIFASLLVDSKENRKKLQNLADLNKKCHLVLQLRQKGRVCYQTS